MKINGIGLILFSALCLSSLLLVSACTKSDAQSNVTDETKAASPSGKTAEEELAQPIEPVVFAPPTVVDVPVVVPVPEKFIPFYPRGGGGGHSRRDEEESEAQCFNDTQEVNPSSLSSCEGLLYGLTSLTSGESTVYTLVTIDPATAAITTVGNVNLEGEVGSIQSIAGMDFTPTGDIILVVSTATSVNRFRIACDNAEILFQTPIYSSDFGVAPEADGVAIDPQGLAFTIIDGDLNNDNTNEVGANLVKFGYENESNADFFTIEPALTIESFPLGLGAIGFLSPNVLRSIDGSNVCEIGKTTATETCTLISGANFSGFPANFAFGQVQSLDQDFASLTNYVVIDDDVGPTQYLATVSFDPTSFTNIATITGGQGIVVALAVNQTYEECDPTSTMAGTTCTETCQIVEADCDDQLDNDMNGLVDCEDTVCSDLPGCEN